MIARMRKLVRSRELGDDRGITMIELLVAMMLVVVLSTIVIGTYQSLVQSVTTANKLNRNTESASLAMNESAREIRAATSNPVSGQTVNDPAFVQATNESLVIYAYVNLQSASIQQPVMVRLRVDTTTRRFIEEIWPATQNASGYWIFPSTATTPTSTRILASTIASRVSPNPYLFTYLAGTAALTVPTTGGFTTTQLNSITSVQITVTVQSSLTDGTRPVTLQNTVGMPNLNS
jgi:prepilin-type N-terminal cleavage/methylation domain-containing protein